MTDRDAGAAVITALADPTRRAIFERVAARAVAVGELALEFPVSRPAVSQHLKVLKEAGLVRDHADGTRRIYSIDPSGLAAVRKYFEQFWTSALAGYRETAEHTHREKT
jgi:DNA-binding transcriptional ArsR family regulator